MQHDEGTQAARRRYLFVLWDAAGALIVELRLAAQLVRRGHTVTVLGPPQIEARVAATGCAFIRDQVMTPYHAARDYHDDEMPWFREHICFGATGALAQEVVAVAGASRADAIVCDDMLYGALVGADASGLPTAALGTTLFGPASRLRRLPPEDPARQFWDWGLDRVNSARGQFGLAPLDSVARQLDALHRYLVLSIPDLDDAESLPANLRYVGPPREEAVPGSAAPAPGTRPTVLISFSTSQQGQRAILQRALDGVAQLPVDGLVTLGDAMATATLRLPANMAAVPFLPHDAVLPRAAAVVTHAGHGTVMAALAHGVPLVCLPMGRDQHHVAARVSVVGAGVTIGADAGASAIAGAIGRILADPSFRDGADRMRVAINAFVQRKVAAGEFERLGDPHGAASVSAS